jgi:hypothetical protein
MQREMRRAKIHCGKEPRGGAGGAELVEAGSAMERYTTKKKKS